MRFNTVSAAAIAMAMTTTLFTYSASAATTTAPAPAQANAGAAEQDMMKYSESGFATMRDIHNARLAIFNGETADAKKSLEDAKSKIAAAEAEAPTFVTTTTMTADGKPVEAGAGKVKDKVVPFDGQLVLGENFLMTPEKKAHIDKANEHLKKGEHAQAIEELRKGDIDITFTRELMPIAKAATSVDAAIKLADDGKYYEANLALKAVEDSVTADTVDILGLARAPSAMS